MTNKKLTIEDILQHKNAIKPLLMTYYSEELNGEIDIKKVNPNIISDIVADFRNTNDTYGGYLKLIYASCPIFKSKELHENYKPVEPFEIVDKVLNSNIKDVYGLGNHILTLYGLIDRIEVTDLKKS